MAAQPVEWVLVVYYGPEAHRAAYGRQVRSNRYTKDYIQLSRKPEFLAAVANIFSIAPNSAGSVPLTYRWPAGTTPGAFVFNSADRPHLKWGTSQGAPQVWKMSPSPSATTAETLPGNPSHLDFADAENELALLASRGAGQPYLMAIKLQGEPRTLHLRVYLGKPSQSFAWADLALTPQEVQDLAARTSRRSALEWALFQSGGTAPSTNVTAALSDLTAATDQTAVINALDADTGRALANQLRQPGHGLFFDSARNHDAWMRPAPLSGRVMGQVEDLLLTLDSRFSAVTREGPSDGALDADPDEVEAFREKIQRKSYAVPDATSTIKTRGSAQKAFAAAVKRNYGEKCAITDIATQSFLVAAHIVPWSEDQSIRLDPSNGICLSLLVDRAFEMGYLLLEDDLTVRMDWSKVGSDSALRSQLEPYDGKKLRKPAKDTPQAIYLQRRRKLVASNG